VSPADLAQAQLDAYNAHDLEAFLACYAEAVEVRDFPSGELRLAGRAAMRARYGPLFERPGLHAELVDRIALGAAVIDQESVRVLRDQTLVSAVAVYEVADELIQRVWFIREGSERVSSDRAAIQTNSFPGGLRGTEPPGRPS